MKQYVFDTCVILFHIKQKIPFPKNSYILSSQIKELTVEQLDILRKRSFKMIETTEKIVDLSFIKLVPSSNRIIITYDKKLKSKLIKKGHAILNGKIFRRYRHWISNNI